MNFYSFARTELDPFLAESESDVFTKLNFDAGLLLVVIYCQDQLDIRYHVNRVESETCYGYLAKENKNTKQTICLLRRPGRIQERHCHRVGHRWFIADHFAIAHFGFGL